MTDRFILTARLQPGARPRALELVAEHEALGKDELAAVDRHAIFLTETEVIFLIEGDGAREAVRAVFNDPARSTVIGRWVPLFDGPLHQAPEVYSWDRDSGSTVARAPLG